LDMIHVRSATAADVPAILPMVAQLCAMHERMDSDKYGFLPAIVEMYRDWLPRRAADARSVLLVAEDGGAAAGFVVGTVEREIPIYRVKEFGFIHDLWVEPSWRRHGAGRMLAACAVERFQAMGVVQVRLDTAAANESARRLFASCGFRSSATEMLRVL
jgi:ribosomal protein S18 acetylase RimI-like enzyme